MTVDEHYSAVSHNDDACELCKLAPVNAKPRGHKLRLALDTALLVLVLACAWVLMYHAGWIVGGVQKW